MQLHAQLRRGDLVVGWDQTNENDEASQGFKKYWPRGLKQTKKVS